MKDKTWGSGRKYIYICGTLEKLSGTQKRQFENSQGQFEIGKES